MSVHELPAMWATFQRELVAHRRRLIRMRPPPGARAPLLAAPLAVYAARPLLSRKRKRGWEPEVGGKRSRG
jgi:hypothetical protein